MLWANFFRIPAKADETTLILIGDQVGRKKILGQQQQTWSKAASQKIKANDDDKMRGISFRYVFLLLELFHT